VDQQDLKMQVFISQTEQSLSGFVAENVGQFIARRKIFLKSRRCKVRWFVYNNLGNFISPRGNYISTFLMGD
jgi:hypothetical protein